MVYKTSSFFKHLKQFEFFNRWQLFQNMYAYIGGPGFYYSIRENSIPKKFFPYTRRKCF